MQQSWTQITINGVTYASVDEMPPEVRKQYEETMGRLMEDRNQNGVPDLFEHPTGETVVNQVTHQVFEGSIGKSDKLMEQIGGTHTITSTPHGLTMGWPTLIALLATVALIAGAFVFWLK